MIHMNKKVYHFYEDPSHGWLKVPLAELDALGLTEKISPYSYMRNGYAYLEEDDDLAIFVKAKGGVRAVYHRADRDSRIRRYDRYKPDAATLKGKA
jgi:hypothetical protein